MLPFNMMVETCGSVIWRAFLLNTPSALVMPTSAPPVIFGGLGILEISVAHANATSYDENCDPSDVHDCL